MAAQPDDARNLTDGRLDKFLSGYRPLTGIFEVYGQTLLALFNSVSNAVETELES